MNKFFNIFFQEARDWCRGRSWVVRLPVLLWFGYIFFRHWNNPDYQDILSGVNLGIHEFGHLVFSPFGKFMNFLGGTLLQCVIPLYGAITFYRQKEFFGIALCFGWLSTSLFGVARYVADARAMVLPLANPFGAENVEHDWNYLLNRIGLLQYDITLGLFVKILAGLSMLICLGLGAWLIMQMTTKKNTTGLPGQAGQ